MRYSDIVVEKIHGILRKRGGGFRPILKTFAVSDSSIPQAEKVSTPMHEAFYGHEGPAVTKWRQYLAVYHRHLHRYQGTAVRFLEIGVLNGGSLMMFRRYFGDQAIIFGVDIDERCAARNGHGGQVRIGSQDDPEFLRQVVQEMGGVDVVLDDGSHIADHQRATFETLMPMLAPDGVYLCEDLHTSYFRGFHAGGYRRKGAFVEVVKRLVDDMHADFHRKPTGVSNAHRTIESIHFYRSIAVIEKSIGHPPMDLTIPTPPNSV